MTNGEQPDVLGSVYERMKKGPRLDIPDPTELAEDYVGSAQRVLNAAETTVRQTWATMRLSRAFETERTGADPRGRPRDRDVDLLRAAIVFAGAGLDATLKELIKTALPKVAETNDEAADEFEKFVAKQVTDAKVLARSIVRSDLSLREEMLDRYVEELTGDSLQSVGQVMKVCRALGVGASIQDRVKEGTLDRMFKERHIIVHEFDLTPKGKWQRQTRAIGDTENLISEALATAQDVINAVATEIDAQADN